MMKKLLRVALIATAGLTMTLTSCKYEEGPGITLLTKKARVANIWEIEESYTNGVLDEDNEDNEGVEWEFTKDGDVSISASFDGLSFSFPGTWEFGDKKETLDVTLTFFDETETTEFKIIRLTNNEMWLEETFDGDVVETRFKSK